MNAENDSNINTEHSLGKGEVESSILSGSTTYVDKWPALARLEQAYSAVSGRTERGHDIAERGESVDSVRHPFTGATMTDEQIKAARKKLIPLRNKEKDFTTRQRMTNCIVVCDDIGGSHSGCRQALPTRTARWRGQNDGHRTSPMGAIGRLNTWAASSGVPPLISREQR